MDKGSATCSILMIEDDADHATIIKRHLSKIQNTALEILEATTLTQGLELLRTNTVDVILLDLSLPDSAIHETIPKLAHLEPEAPIIALTSLDDLELAAQAVQDGAQDYLVKSEVTTNLLQRSITYAVELKKQKLILEKTNRELQRFASTVAHEIRSPLSVIVSGLAMIKRRETESIKPSSLELIDKTEARALEMSGLVSELLNFAHFTPDLEIQANCLSELVEEVTQQLRGKIRRKNAVITFENLPAINCDKTLFKQVFKNLLENALKYCKKDPRIQVSADDSSTDWFIYVSDNGIGIPEESTGLIFDIFRRGSNSKEFKGTGIGLALTKRIVEHHHGKIWVEPIKDSSNNLAGSVFKISIPKKPLDEESSGPSVDSIC